MRIWVIAATDRKKRSPLSYALLTCIVGTLLGLICAAVALVNDKQIVVSAWDREVRLHNPGKTVEEAIAEAGIVLGPMDRVTPALDSPVKNGMKVDIQRAEPVFVKKGESVTTYLTCDRDVSRILDLAGVEPGPDDIVVPAVGKNVSETGLLRIVEVTFAEVTENVQVPFATERRNDSSIEAGLTKVYRYGSNGVSRVDYKVRYEDGVEVSRQELGRELVTEPKAQVVLVGTLQEVSRGGENIRFVKAFEMRSTAYCPCTKCCGPNAKGVTALGVPAKPGVIAVDPRIIPLGTRVYVDGYGYALAADTGGAIRGNKIDVCYETHDEALRWGMRNTKVYVLE
ncbi:MAG: 3D domain-containing protein [Bacillota bacterium]